MFTIFKPVFESVWKRKETKIYLSFAIIFPLVFLASTFLPEGSNFMVPTVEGDYRFTFLNMFMIILMAALDLTLPVLALFYLTYTVFRGEVDSHTLFLYKDIKRRDVFWAKLASLLLITIIFFGLFFLVMLGVYYGRVGYMPYASLTFWDKIPEDGLHNLYAFITYIFDGLVSILLATCLSLYAGLGKTMTAAFTYEIGTALLSIFGLGILVPNGLSNNIFEGMPFVTALGLSSLITLIYSSILIFLSLKFFKKIEF
ncbi:hypothetical protein ACVR05_06895 [Streptococcus caprae]|uniref:ABC transporter permease n=1 Tax=Streptococcus caprae TaxID=1640501 RepID=A0ABV8CW66_9STRE